MIFCSVCFGDPTSPLIHGYNNGVMFLGAVVAVVLACFGGMFLKMRTRIKKLDK